MSLPPLPLLTLVVSLSLGCSDQRFFLQVQVEVSEELLDLARTEGPLGITTPYESQSYVELIVCHEQGHPDRADGLHLVGYREPVDGGGGLSRIEPAQVVRASGPVTLVNTYEERRCDYREFSVGAELVTLAGIATCEDAIALEYVEEAKAKDLLATTTITADTGDGACWRRSLQHPIDGSDAWAAVEDDLEPVVVELGVEHRTGD